MPHFEVHPTNYTGILLPTRVFLCFPRIYVASPTALVDFYLSVYFNILISFYNTSNYRTGRFLYTRVRLGISSIFITPPTARVDICLPVCFYLHPLRLTPKRTSRLWYTLVFFYTLLHPFATLTTPLVDFSIPVRFYHHSFEAPPKKTH